MEEKKIIEKIRKALALSVNNPSEGEGKTAALMAQKLMAKYHISMEQVNIKEAEEISEKRVIAGNGNKWKYTLAYIIAENFRCKIFTIGSDTLCFYGYDTDAEIASMTFEALFKIGNKGANNYYQNKRNEAQRNGEYFYGKGLKNSFLAGYLEGIRGELEKQSVALMVITPDEVKEAYNKRTAVGFKTRNSSFKFRNNCDARDKGRTLGRDSVRKNRLEEKCS